MSDFVIHPTAGMIGEADRCCQGWEAPGAPARAKLASLTTANRSPNSPSRDEWQAAISSGGVRQIKSRHLNRNYLAHHAAGTPRTNRHNHDLSRLAVMATASPQAKREAIQGRNALPGSLRSSPLAFAATSNRLSPDAPHSTLTPLSARSSR
jgi:hypothetical protein